MPGKRGSSKGKRHSMSAKVGSDPKADRAVGGKLDFGIPAARATPPPGGFGKGPEQGTGPMRSGSRAIRTSGVGYPPGPDGAGSGGDLDPDFIGLDKKGGIANDPSERRTTGPDITTGHSDALASGPPARGENELPAGTHGAAPEIVRGSTTDRSGGDASPPAWEPAPMLPAPAWTMPPPVRSPATKPEEQQVDRMSACSNKRRLITRN